MDVNLTVSVLLENFKVPDSLCDSDGREYRLDEITEASLVALCDRFVAQVMDKAGFNPPVSTPSTPATAKKRGAKS